jgi:hypothetical protein
MYITLPFTYKLTNMTNNYLKLIFTISIAAMMLTLLGCKKAKKGVLEMRVYSINTGSFGSIHDDYFYAFSVDNDFGLVNGEKKTFYNNGRPDMIGGPGSTHADYIYHEDESLTSLGYTKKNPGEEEGKLTNFGVLHNAHIHKKGSIYPGEKSGFGRIAGNWTYNQTGEEIWIDGDNAGSAMLMKKGSIFPDEAVGGYCLKNINKSGDNTYTATNYTYFPGQGWVEGSSVTLTLDESGKSFSLGSVTWERSY